MKHQTYAKKRMTLLERVNAWLRGPRFIVMNPEFTNKHPGTVHDYLGLRAPK